MTRFGLTRYQTLTVVAAIATLTLIAVGALVRTTGSGLGCPDWPLCHGHLFPPAQKTAIIEYSHRSLAAIVGFLIVAVAFVTVRYHREDRTLVQLAVASLPLLALQAWFGKITVERELPAEVVTVHLATAMILLAIVSLIALLAYLGEDRTRLDGAESLEGRQRATIAKLAVVASAITFAVILGGSYVVGSNATTACNSWPGCSAAPIPFLDGVRATHIHWLHRLSVLVGLGAILTLALRTELMAGASIALRRAAWGLVVLYLGQVILGALNIWTDFSEAARVAHLAGGSAVWALAVLIAVGVRFRPGEQARALEPQREAGPATSRGPARV